MPVSFPLHSARRALAPVLLLLGFAGIPGAAQADEALAPPLQLQCGGIGSDESARLLGETPQHSLTLLFVSQDGHYLSDVATRVSHPLLDVQAEAASCGPVGQVDTTRAGRYRLEARYGGKTQELWVDLKPKGGRRLILRWKEE